MIKLLLLISTLITLISCNQFKVQVVPDEGNKFPSSDSLGEQTSTIDTGLYVTNGDVNSIVASGSDLYIGGNFTYVGPSTGNGIIWATVADGSGGFYIGGYFNKVGEVTRNNIAHILADGSLDSNFNPNADSDIYAMALSGNDLCVGENFTEI